MFIDVDGAPAFVADGGQEFDPARPSVVFMHGAGMDHTVWGQQTRYVAHRGFNVLAADLPGHGRSGGAPLPTIEALADWTAELIAAAGAGPAIVTGHSMGALAALSTAARHPDRVSALALCGVAAKMPVHPALLKAAESNDVKAAELIADWGHGPRAHKGGNIASGVWLIGSAVRLVERARPGVLANDLAACNDYQAAAEEAARVTCPVLFLLAARDKMTPVRAARPLIEAVANAREHIVAEAGHMMMLEAQQETRDALIGFYRSVAAGVEGDAA